jgi:histone deacetylase 11
VIKLVYSPNYNIGFMGMERLHPFDSRKYGRAWNLLEEQFGVALAPHHVQVDRQITNDELQLVHSPEYLESLRSSSAIAKVLEISVLKTIPAGVLQKQILDPVRWSVRGSVIAGREALLNGAAINFSGGYHHAKPSGGEGFCFFSDIALMVRQLREEKLLRQDDQVVYIDLDAHQGNGVAHQFLQDRTVSIFDMYNGEIYPGNDTTAINRIDHDIPLKSGCPGAEYLRILRDQLPQFLNNASPAKKPALAIYNAGTDVYFEDDLGRLALSTDDVLQRDIFVFEELQRRDIPIVMLLSGGYSQKSHQLIAATAAYLIKDESA